MAKSNESKSTRNDGRMTHVSGIIANMQEQTFTTFECDVPYARSNDKLAKSVREVMQLDDACMVSISEIVQTEKERKIYDTGLLYLSGAEMFLEEDEAKERAKEIHGKCVAGKLYEYRTHVFWFDIEENEYGVTDFDYQTGYNCTAQDARAMLYMRFEELYERKPIAMHVFENQRGFIKHEYTTYYVGSAELFADCERVVKHREK